VMTFWWSDDNYGQLLQCYALQRHLRDAGHDAYLIRYDPRLDYPQTPFFRKVLKAMNPVKAARYLYNKGRGWAARMERERHPRRFAEFRDKYIRQTERIYSFDDLVSAPPPADKYIAGSDQVWNPDFMNLKQTDKQLRAFFLDFGGEAVERASYAASFGNAALSDGYIDRIRPLLRRFSHVGVREKSALALCAHCGVRNAAWENDPTLLFDAQTYRALARDEAGAAPGKPYCLLYMLNGRNGRDIKAAFDWAARRDLGLVYVSGNSSLDRYPKVYPTIPQWLGLIDNARFVITNSFHGTLFSLLFGKEVKVIPAVGRDAARNDRFESLFERFGVNKDDLFIEDLSRI